MKKIYLTAAVLAAMSTTFVSCTNEMDESLNSPASSLVEGQTGRIVFNVNTGKSVSFTRSAVSEDQVINKLSVFVFKANGELVPGVKQDYEGSDITDGKLAVVLPADQMNKTGFKAYLVANVVPGGITTEAQLQGFIATTTPADVATAGIPMVSAPISINTTTPIIAAEATMKRAMSSLFVTVNAVTSGSTTINAGDFTYKVKAVRLDKGFLCKDEVCGGEVVAEETWTPKGNTNADELLGYMYQSNGFEVEVTPSVDKPELGSQSRIVVVAADKAMKRNKKYLLNVLPTVSESGKIDFTVTVEEWDATDGSFNVDWAERTTIKKALPVGVEQRDGMVVFKADRRHYGMLNTIFDFAENVKSLESVNWRELGYLDDKGERNGLTYFTESGFGIRGTDPVDDYTRTLKFAVEKAGVKSYEEYPILIKGNKVAIKDGYNNGVSGNGNVYEYDNRIEVVLPAGPATALIAPNKAFALSKDYEITGFRTSALSNEDGQLSDATFTMVLEHSNRIVLTATSLPATGRVKGVFVVNLRNKKNSTVDSRQFDIHLL